MLGDNPPFWLPRHQMMLLLGKKKDICVIQERQSLPP